MLLYAWQIRATEKFGSPLSLLGASLIENLLVKGGIMYSQFYSALKQDSYWVSRIAHILAYMLT